MKPYILAGSSVVIIMFLIVAVAFVNKKNDVPVNHLEIVLRDIGHRLLLQSGDSASRVLPVKKLNDNTYQISFQNDFFFISDSLVSLVQRQFGKYHLPEDYVVQVRDCRKKEVVFAFEVSAKAGNLVPCRGRVLDAGCYWIEIEFVKAGKFNSLLFLLLLIPLAAAGYYGRRKLRKKEVQEPVSDDKDYIQLGKFSFYAEKRLLVIENNSISLSEKEAKALKIFAENIDQVIEREKLMKEIWEDEGIVVISRNVDVLVSKLRKKLSEDDSIKIINVHGRGYKFIMD